MNGQIISAVAAIGLGFAVGALLFVPFVAVSYRRRGRLAPGRAMIWGAALIYFWAIWTYTLLPLPSPDDLQCVGTITDPWQLVRDLRGALAQGSGFLTDPAFLQIALNVLLFLPLGFFLRVLGGRGIILAVLIGFAVSLAVETTQLTGVWGIYPCAYRFFDVGDLITNTTGAFLGSLVGLIVPRRHRGLDESPDADLPRPVTRGRRVLAMLCDALGFTFVGAAVSVGVTAWRLYLLEDRMATTGDELAVFVGTVVPAVLWIVIVLVTGQTVGDAAVQLRYSGGRLPVPLARLLRGLAGYAGISAIPLLGDIPALAVPILVLLSIILVFTTRRGRGLPGVLSGQQLHDARADRSSR